jgi:gliding motility-associated-like protein
VTKGDLSTTVVSGATGTMNTTTGIWTSNPIDESVITVLNVIDENACNFVNIPNLTRKCSCLSTFTYDLTTGVICANENDTITVDIVSSATDNSSGGWTATLTGLLGSTATKSSGVQGETSASIEFVGLTAADEYSVTVKDDGKGCQASTLTNPKNLTVNPLPTVAIFTTSAATYCEEGGTVPNLDVTFTGSSSFMYEYTDGIGATVPKTATGTSDIIRSNNPISDYTAKTYAITSLVDGNGCVGSVFGPSASISRNETPSSPTFTTDFGGTSICEGQPYTITASSSSTNPSTTIEWLEGAIGTEGNPSTKAGNTTAGSHIYKAVATINGCSSEPSEKSIEVEQSANIILTPSSTVSCQDDVVTFTTEVSYVEPTEYRWYLDGEAIHQTDEGNISFNLQSSSIVKVVIDNNLACGGEVKDEHFIEVIELFVPILNTQDSIGCEEDGAILLTVKDQSGLPATPEYVWERNGIIIQNNNTANLNVTESGEYSVVMKNGNCDSEIREDQTIANVVIQELSVEFIASATDVDKGTEVLLTAVVNDEIGSITYEWRGEDQGDIATSSTTDYVYIADTSDMMYVFIKDIQTGCTAESNHELINVLLPIDLPNAFTPNGDGINDTWTIGGLDTYRNAVLRIYNRWGQVVYTNSGSYNNDWDGTRNGKNLPVGTYYYVITLNQDGRENKSGDVSIIR